MGRDAMGRYGYNNESKVKTDQTGEDEKGKYEVYKITKEVNCKCHPETCVHFGGKTIETREEKVYVD